MSILSILRLPPSGQTHTPFFPFLNNKKDKISMQRIMKYTKVMLIFKNFLISKKLIET